MLDRGATDSFRAIGIDLRVIAYIEREKEAQKIILARQRDGLLDAGPIWPDVCGFPGASYRGIAQVGIGGFPCQPFSVAGKRLGKADERYLFGDMLRVAADAGLSILLLENVAGLLIPDESERAPVGDVFRLLAESGFNARWIDLGSEDVGSPHGRHRWWCIAWR